MRGKLLASAMVLAALSACAAATPSPQKAAAPDGKRRGLEPTEMNDGGLRQAPPPPEDGESAHPESQPQAA